MNKFVLILYFIATIGAGILTYGVYERTRDIQVTAVLGIFVGIFIVQGWINILLNVKLWKLDRK
jgi:hypothetical protein